MMIIAIAAALAIGYFAGRLHAKHIAGKIAQPVQGGGGPMEPR